MGKSLKTIDILGKIDAEEGTALSPSPEDAAKPAKPAPPKRKAANQATAGPDDSDKRQRREEAAIAAAGKPSAYQAELRVKLRDKIQLNFAAVPRFVREEYDRLAAEHDMNMREFLYHLLREKGADIPPYKDMDGRKL
jgi:hypothetical protein